MRVCVCVSGGRERYRGRKYETRDAWKKQASLSAKRFDSLWINVTVQDCGTIASKIPADSMENRRKPKAPVFSPTIVSIVQHGSHDSLSSPSSFCLGFHLGPRQRYFSQRLGQ